MIHANNINLMYIVFFISVTTSTDYWVLDTDYDSYALVYTCFNIDLDTRGGKKLFFF